MKRETQQYDAAIERCLNGIELNLGMNPREPRVVCDEQVLVIHPGVGHRRRQKLFHSIFDLGIEGGVGPASFGLWPRPADFQRIFDLRDQLRKMMRTAVENDMRVQTRPWLPDSPRCPKENIGFNPEGWIESRVADIRRRISSGPVSLVFVHDGRVQRVRREQKRRRRMQRKFEGFAEGIPAATIQDQHRTAVTITPSVAKTFPDIFEDLRRQFLYAFRRGIPVVMSHDSLEAIEMFDVPRWPDGDDWFRKGEAKVIDPRRKDSRVFFEAEWGAKAQPRMPW